MKILKFGGSSVGNPGRIKKVIEIIQNSAAENKKIAAVFSAFQGVTDQLINISKLASNGNSSYEEILKEIEKRHIAAAKELIDVKRQSSILASLKMNLNELDDVVHGVFLVKEISPRTLDFIMSFGERMSAYLIAEALKDKGTDAEFLDSRKLVKTDDNFGSARINFEATNKNISSYFKSNNKTQIITGFIGTTLNNETTTIGRGGSDYTASIFGAALNVDEIQIWTDVDGVLTANPTKVKKAFSLESITYEEAMELSHFGAKVIHPPTMQPAMNKKIPIRIKNTFSPDFAGTVIQEKNPEQSFAIKGISSIDNIALLRVQGSGMIGVAGIAQRIFGALARKYINIILITQASSEHSLCIAVLPQFAESARQAIKDEIKYEIRDNLINEPLVENDLSIIAIVGENMRRTPGISGKVFQALGRNGVNIVAIAQGSSELNISTVVSKANESKALNALHDAFFLSLTKSLHVFLAGTGLIGSTMLKQIQNQYEFLKKEYSLSINIAGLANSDKMYVDGNGIDIEQWKNKLSSEGTKSNINRFVKEMINLNLPNSVFVDCTSSDAVVAKYKSILDSAISIVTPNKKANSGSYSYYKDLRHSAFIHNVKFMYETNVGAGLPIIGTLQDLVTSGDKVLKIEGVLSGTLSYIFNSYTSGKKFSEIVAEAKEKGYTEPDPRDDLKGTDVARKLLILAREIGLQLELDDVKVENLVPEEARNSRSIDSFFNKLKKYDDSFEKRRSQAEAENKVLRYIAKLENGKAEIALQAVEKNHPAYLLNGSDNILIFTTKHYEIRPIVIKGPGAGADVTAAGVFADVIRIANYLS